METKPNFRNPRTDYKGGVSLQAEEFERLQYVYQKLLLS
jgi:hypothetical protein